MNEKNAPPNVSETIGKRTCNDDALKLELHEMANILISAFIAIKTAPKELQDEKSSPVCPG